MKFQASGKNICTFAQPAVGGCAGSDFLPFKRGYRVVKKWNLKVKEIIGKRIFVDLALTTYFVY
jgi:hypothetical protein